VRRVRTPSGVYSAGRLPGNESDGHLATPHSIDFAMRAPDLSERSRVIHGFEAVRSRYWLSLSRSFLRGKNRKSAS
jgi:hypothetical protein